MNRPSRACNVLTVLAIPLCGLARCGPSAIEGGFDSANPAAKIYAIEQATRSNQTSAIRQIIPELDSDDPAVRLMAIEALDRMTGQTYGYRHYDPAALRRASIARWLAALDAGEVPGTAAAPEPEVNAAHADDR